MLKKAKRLAENTSLVLCAISGVAVVVMVGLVTYSSASRYAFHSAVPYMEEVAGLLLMVTCFLSFAYVFVKGGHIRVVLVMDRFSPRAKGYIELVDRAILLFYLIIFTIISFDFVKVSYILDCHTSDSHLYEVPWMAVMPVGGAIFIVIILISIIEAVSDIIVKKKKAPEFEKLGVVAEEETKTF
jgi:TRAP-type C4-dicarboxylate transport system permease small subunit